jgi:putative transposase
MGSLDTVFGWRIQYHDEVNGRSQANYPMQANGAEMLRLACIAAGMTYLICSMEGETISYSIRSRLMKQKQHSTEEIIRILRQAETDETIDSVCREHNVSKATFHRWKRKYGDMDLADAKRLKELEKENSELKKMLAESLLKNRILEEVNAKKW